MSEDVYGAVDLEGHYLAIAMGVLPLNTPNLSCQAVLYPMEGKRQKCRKRHLIGRFRINFIIGVGEWVTGGLQPP